MRAKHAIAACSRVANGGLPSSGLGRGLGHLPPRGKAIETAAAAPVRTRTFAFLLSLA